VDDIRHYSRWVALSALGPWWGQCLPSNLPFFATVLTAVPSYPVGYLHLTDTRLGHCRSSSSSKQKKKGQCRDCIRSVSRVVGRDSPPQALAMVLEIDCNLSFDDEVVLVLLLLSASRIPSRTLSKLSRQYQRHASNRTCIELAIAVAVVVVCCCSLAVSP
jgi:hypothetical protein